MQGIDPLGLESLNMGPAVNERASLGLWLTQNGASQEEISKAMAPFSPPSPISRECRLSGIMAAGTGISGTAAYNERSGESGQWGVPVAAVGFRGRLLVD